MKTKAKRSRLTVTGEKISTFLPPDLATTVRIEAAHRRETLVEVLARRIEQSYRDHPLPAQAG